MTGLAMIRGFWRLTFRHSSHTLFCQSRMATLRLTDGLTEGREGERASEQGALSLLQKFSPGETFTPRARRGEGANHRMTCSRSSA